MVVIRRIKLSNFRFTIYPQSLNHTHTPNCKKNLSLNEKN